jgi:hypothetical protein
MTTPHGLSTRVSYHCERETMHSLPGPNGGHLDNGPST